MLIQRLQPSLRSGISSIGRTAPEATSQTCLADALSSMSICSSRTTPIYSFRASGSRYASHKAQGAVNKGKDGPGKRLGAKKTGEQYVIPGNIIFRQRGTSWFPGDNCAMGRDHTIYATESGYVKYYKDPEKHPKRQYIGVVFKRDQVLPLPRNAMRRRRLGMETVRMDMHTSAAPTTPANPDLVDAGPNGHSVVPAPATALDEPSTLGQVRPAAKISLEPIDRINSPVSLVPGRQITLRPGYMYRESNWEIGRAAERANIKVREYKRGDRWLAWRKREARQKINAEKRTIGRTKAKSKSKSRR